MALIKPFSADKRGEYLSAAFIVLVSVLALLPSWMHYDIIANDGAFRYVPIAELLLQGKYQQAMQTQNLLFFPMLIAMMSTVTGMVPELAGRLLAVSAFVVSALGIYRLCLFLFNNRSIGLLAVLFVLTNLELVDNSVHCLKESLFVACIVWGNYHLLHWIDKRRSIRLVCGVTLLSAATLLRSTAFFFIGAWLLLWVFHRREGMLPRLCIVISPLILILVLWFVNPNLPIFICSYNLGLILDHEHTPVFLLNAADGAIKEFLVTGNPFIIFFAAAGIYMQRRNLYVRYVLLVLTIYSIILILWGFVSGRYLLAPIVSVYPHAAFAVHAAWLSRKKTMRICSALAVVFCIMLWGYLANLPSDPDKLARKDSGLFIMDRVGPGHEVITNRPRVAFYAKGILKPLSVADLERGHYAGLALDVSIREDKIYKSRLDQAGVKPAAVFGSIYVYLSKP